MGNVPHLQDYINILRKRFVYFVGFFCATYACVLFWTLTTTPIYVSTTKVLIDKMQSMPISKETPYVQFLNQVDSEFYETQSQIIKSRLVAQRVYDIVKDDPLFDSYVKSSTKRGLLRSVVYGLKGLFNHAPTTDSDAQRESAINVIADQITIQVVRNSSIILIGYASPNSHLSRLMANTVAQAYIESVFNMKMGVAKNYLNWVASKVDEERQRVEVSEQKLQDYMQQSGIVMLDNRMAVMPEKLSELTSQIIIAETSRKEIESLYNKVSKLPLNGKGAENILAVVNDPAVQSIRQEHFEAEKEVSDLSKKYGLRHPLMQQAQGKLDNLSQRLQSEMRRVVSSIRNEYEIAQDKERSLKSLLDSTESDAIDLSDKMIRYNALKREVDSNRQVFDFLIQQMKEQTVTQELQDIQIMVLDEAMASASPARPNRSKVLLVGFFLSLSGGLFLAFFIDYLDQTVKGPEDVERLTGLSLMGIIPTFKDDPNDPKPGNYIEKISLLDQKSPLTEPIKTMRASITHLLNDANYKAIIVTSVVPGEGKTTMSINLAITMAQARKRVVLIDADMRRPRLHKVFGLKNQVGLSTYLIGKSKKVLQQGPIENLSIITAGPTFPTPSDLLHDDQLSELLAELRENFDVIICDSAPVMSVSDTMLLSKHFDCCLLVVRSRLASYKEIRAGIKNLTDVKTHIIGVVLNAMDLQRGDYYYRHYDYYT